MIDYTKFVNIKQGTFSESRFSTGNTLPLVSAPFGMNRFCLQTQGNAGGWFYHPTHRHTQGIRLTHQPSPWVRDYGHFVIMPQCGQPYVKENLRSSGFEEINMKPSFMEIYFKRYHALLGIAPTTRGAIMSIKWNTNQTPRLAFLPFEFLTRLSLDPVTSELTGYVNAYGDGTRKDFKMYFYMKFDCPVNVEETFLTQNSGEMKVGLQTSEIGAGINIAFHLPQNQELTVRFATSFICAELAKENAEHEIGNNSYGDIKIETTNKWNELLSRIEITDTLEKKKTFYSCLYRCFLFPQVFYEIDKNGKQVHYSTKSGELNPGVMYTGNGFWDTFRTLYPLFALLIPNQLREILQGYLNFYKEEGWLPKWVSPGERGIMPGTLIDAVLTDAAVKGILSKQQMELALEGMIKNATTPGDSHLHGRVGVQAYGEKGYVPSDQYPESVNNALDGYYCDYCIAVMAGLLGKPETYAEFLQRSSQYKLLFDEKEGFIRGLKANGERLANFSPISWGGEYCEGGAWQNGFGVYHDIDGLAALYGGHENLSKKLDELFCTPPDFQVGTYPLRNS